MVTQYEDQHQWLQQASQGPAAGGRIGEAGRETIYPANQMALTKGGYVSWKDVGHVRMRNKPFASGGQRLAYHLFVVKHKDKGAASSHHHLAAHNETSGGCAGHRHLVGKESKFEEEYRHRLKFHTIDLALQEKASELAHKFNQCLRRALLIPPECPQFMTRVTDPSRLESGRPWNVPIQITMLALEIYRLQDDKVKGGFRYVSAEPYLEGSFVKYNGNNGYVAKEGAGQDAAWLVAQAFTHWTFEFTSKETDETLMVCDIQGVNYRSYALQSTCNRVFVRPVIECLGPQTLGTLKSQTLLTPESLVHRYTDPSITSLAKRFGKADLGMQGYQLFFGSHKCNELCSKLGLERRDLDPASVCHTAKTPEAPRYSESKASRAPEHVAGAVPGAGGAARASEAEAQRGALEDLAPARIAQLLVNKVTVRKFFPKYGYFDGEILKYDAERELFSGRPHPNLLTLLALARCPQ